MKKTIYIILAIIAVILTLSAFNWIDSTYTRQATVIDSTVGIVTVRDMNGNIWEYKGSAVKGDTITLIMNDNHTTTIKDDTIEEVK